MEERKRTYRCREREEMGRERTTRVAFFGHIVLSSPAGMGRIVGLLIVNFVLSLISFIAYSSQIFVIWPWYGRELSVELITLLLPFK